MELHFPESSSACSSRSELDTLAVHLRFGKWKGSSSHFALGVPMVKGGEAGARGHQCALALLSALSSQLLSLLTNAPRPLDAWQQIRSGGYKGTSCSLQSHSAWVPNSFSTSKGASERLMAFPRSSNSPLQAFISPAPPTIVQSLIPLIDATAHIIYRGSAPLVEP